MPTTKRSSSGGSKRGFAAMSAEKQREIASKGGRAAHEKGTAHEWTADEQAETEGEDENRADIDGEEFHAALGSQPHRAEESPGGAVDGEAERIDVGPRPAGHFFDAVPVDVHGSPAGGLKPADKFQHGRFTGAGRAGYEYKFARFHPKIDVGQNVPTSAVGFEHVLKFDHGGCKGLALGWI